MYLLFAFNNAQGGIDDLEGVYETLDDAISRFSLTSILAKDTAYIYNPETDETWSYDFKEMKVRKD